MAIRFRCQFCTGLMSIASRRAGAQVQCPTCGQTITVPAEDALEPALSIVEPPVVNPPDVEPGIVDPREVEPPFASDGSSMDAAEADADQAAASSLAESKSTGMPAAQPLPAPPVMAEQFVDFPDEQVGDEDAPPMQFRRRQNLEDDMDLTPMVDVTFQLLIFFMVTASFALQKSIESPTPDPEKKGAAQQLQILEDLEGSSIRVTIDAANAIMIDDDPLPDPARLIDTLKDKMRKEQKTEVLISVHPAALHRTVISVIDASNSVGMQKIRLLSRQGKSE